MTNPTPTSARRSTGALQMSRWLALILLVGLTWPTPAIAQDPPLDIGIPTDPTLGDVLGTSSGDGNAKGVVPGVDLCRTAPRKPISLPADDGAHNDTFHEWWWWYGHLTTPDGRRFGYMVLFESKPWLAVQNARYAVTDLSDGSFHHGTSPVVRDVPREIEGRFELGGSRASAVGGDGRDRVRIRVGGYDLDLTLTARDAPVNNGPIQGLCNSAEVYSRERIPTRGTIGQGTRKVPVVGASHFFHLWGFTPGFVVAHVTAFTFDLDDGRSLFAGELRLREGGEEFTLRIGSLTDRDGSVMKLGHDDIEFIPGRRWRRSPTCSYPVEWQVRVGDLHLRTRAALDSTELRPTDPVSLALFPEWPFIWDGEIVVTGDARGVGWLDMTHYCYL